MTEATHTSVVWVRGGRLEGRPRGRASCRGPPGSCSSGSPTRSACRFAEARVTLAELIAADEVLLVGTTIEVLPIVRIDDNRVGDGRPGPIAARLQDAYRAAVERWLARSPSSRV